MDGSYRQWDWAMDTKHPVITSLAWSQRHLRTSAGAAAMVADEFRAVSSTLPPSLICRHLPSVLPPYQLSLFRLSQPTLLHTNKCVDSHISCSQDGWTVATDNGAGLWKPNTMAQLSHRQRGRSDNYGLLQELLRWSPTNGRPRYSNMGLNMQVVCVVAIIVGLMFSGTLITMGMV
ncbi:Hypp457 [Branchiostoma lanceolatum]|uniref:Hypp457 protein n=1 Tax=Branchiostoma lanceolatum TaxID=7740 RepID=A0A8J9VMA1_BRALA|nr:Hypp457 [Branchiostoma lanceolatum]